MTNLKKSIFYLLILLAFVFNVERLDIGGENIVDIASFLYVLIMASVFIILFLRRYLHLSPVYTVTSWLVVYLALKLFVFNSHPLIGNIYTYLTITEIVLLVVSVLLALNMANNLADFENVIEKVTFPQSGRITEMKEVQEAVKTEFIRSRRHNRPLSVIVAELEPHTSKENLERTVKIIQQSMFNRFLFASLVKIMSDDSRRTDIIIEQKGKNQFVLLCPETTPPGSVVVAERVQQLAFEKLGVHVKCGFASFPDDALTFDDLKSKASMELLSPDEMEAKISSGELPVENTAFIDPYADARLQKQS